MKELSGPVLLWRNLIWREIECLFLIGGLDLEEQVLCVFDPECVYSTANHWFQMYGPLMRKYKDTTGVSCSTFETLNSDIWVCARLQI